MGIIESRATSTYIHVDSDGSGYWQAHGDNVANGDHPYPNGDCVGTDTTHRYRYWSSENRTVPVPVGRWFHIQIYLDRGDRNGDNGRFMQAVDGKVVHDHRGSLWPKIADGTSYCSGTHNFKATALQHISFPSQYGGGVPEPEKPIAQWVDDPVYYRGVPCDQLPCRPADSVSDGSRDTNDAAVGTRDDSGSASDASGDAMTDGGDAMTDGGDAMTDGGDAMTDGALSGHPDAATDDGGHGSAPSITCAFVCHNEPAALLPVVLLWALGVGVTRRRRLRSNVAVRGGAQAPRGPRTALSLS